MLLTLKYEIAKGSDQMREPFQGGWHRCPVCGKLFRIPADKKDWTFAKMRKGKKTYYCSWGCIRLMEREIEIREEEKHGREG